MSMLPLLLQMDESDCWAWMSSRSQRPLNRNLDLKVNRRLDDFIFGTSTPRLKLLGNNNEINDTV